MDQPQQPTRPQAPQAAPSPATREAAVEDVRGKMKRGEFTPFLGPRLGSDDTLAPGGTLLGGRARGGA